MTRAGLNASWFCPLRWRLRLCRDLRPHCICRAFPPRTGSRALHPKRDRDGFHRPTRCQNKWDTSYPWLVVALAVLVRGGARWRRTTHCAKSVAGPPFRHGVPQTNSPSCQSRNASKARLGVQANIMPKNTACKVVISFRSLDVTFARDKRFGRPSVACQTSAVNNAAALLLHICGAQ